MKDIFPFSPEFFCEFLVDFCRSAKQELRQVESFSLLAAALNLLSVYFSKCISQNVFLKIEGAGKWNVFFIGSRSQSVVRLLLLLWCELENRKIF